MSTPGAHFLLLRTALATATNLVANDPKRCSVPPVVQLCRQMVADGVGCHVEGAVHPDDRRSALSPFLEFPKWTRYHDCRDALKALFADYAAAGLIVVDSRQQPHAAPAGSSAPLPLEVAVERGSLPTLVALIEAGADETLVVGGDLLAFIDERCAAVDRPEWKAAAAEALMRRRMGPGDSSTRPDPRKRPRMGL